MSTDPGRAAIAPARPWCDGVRACEKGTSLGGCRPGETWASSRWRRAEGEGWWSLG